MRDVAERLCAPGNFRLVKSVLFEIRSGARTAFITESMESPSAALNMGERIVKAILSTISRI